MNRVSALDAIDPEEEKDPEEKLPSKFHDKKVEEGRILERRALCADMFYRQNMRIPDILEALTLEGFRKKDGSAYSTSTVKKDLQMVRQWWRDWAIEAFGDVQGETLAKLDALEKEAKDNYETAKNTGNDMSLQGWWTKIRQSIIDKYEIAGGRKQTQIAIEAKGDADGGRTRVILSGFGGESGQVAQSEGGGNPFGQAGGAEDSGGSGPPDGVLRGSGESDYESTAEDDEAAWDRPGEVQEGTPPKDGGSEEQDQAQASRADG